MTLSQPSVLCPSQCPAPVDSGSSSRRQQMMILSIQKCLKISGLIKCITFQPSADTLGLHLQGRGAAPVDG